MKQNPLTENEPDQGDSFKSMFLLVIRVLGSWFLLSVCENRSTQQHSTFYIKGRKSEVHKAGHMQPDLLAS